MRAAPCGLKKEYKCYENGADNTRLSRAVCERKTNGINLIVKYIFLINDSFFKSAPFNTIHFIGIHFQLECSILKMMLRISSPIAQIFTLSPEFTNKNAE